jgi:hypothetical protein
MQGDANPVRVPMSCLPAHCTSAGGVTGQLAPLGPQWVYLTIPKTDVISVRTASRLPGGARTSLVSTRGIAVRMSSRVTQSAQGCLGLTVEHKQQGLHCGINAEAILLPVAQRAERNM